MSNAHQAPSVGVTGGLPGYNAAPETTEIPADDLDDTVSTGAAFESVPETDDDPVDDEEAVRIARNGGYLEEE
jgi:hypothetical protein